MSHIAKPVGIKVTRIGQGVVRVSRWGTSARLVAVPAPNHVFVAWGGHVRGNENPLDLELQGNAYVVARFAAASTQAN